MDESSAPSRGVPALLPGLFFRGLDLHIAHIYLPVHQQYRRPTFSLPPVLRTSRLCNIDDFNLRTVVLNPLLPPLIHHRHKVPPTVTRMLIALIRPLVVLVAFTLTPSNTHYNASSAPSTSAGTCLHRVSAISHYSGLILLLLYPTTDR